MYRTVIVEDDPMIASINQTFLSRDPRFSLAAVFHSGQEAWSGCGSARWSC